jgi:hypothetical protein
MKKISYFLLAAFALPVILSSCEKEYTCTCTGSYMGLSADTVIALGKMKRKEAKDKCEDYDAMGTWALMFGGTFDCEL